MSDMLINGVSNSLPLQRVQPKISSPENQKGFDDILTGAIGEVNKLHHEADQAVEALAAGRSADVHNTMIALQKADVSFQLLMQIRNKVLSAYETVMRMQI
jgi:flagellar hook-basal body complex protein FliE